MDKVFTFETVVAAFRECNPQTSEDVVAEIRALPYWTREQWGIDRLSKVRWYVETTPGHITQPLTHGGKFPHLEHVAQTYLSQHSELQSTFPEFVDQIDGMISSLEQGRTFPPLIIGRGRMRGDLYFIDGVHRGLALMVHRMANPERDVMVDVFVGSFWGGDPLTCVWRLLQAQLHIGVKTS